MRLGLSQLMQLWVLPSASFVFSFSYLHAVHLGSSQGRHYTAKGNRARPPGGCREVVLCDLAFVRLCVLVQILPLRSLATTESLVCVLLSKTKPLPVTPIRLPLQSIF